MTKHSKVKINLTGRNIMVTRPKPLGDILCEHIEKAEGKAVYFPTIDIEHPADTTILKHQIAKLSHQDWLIFISPQAVFASSKLIHQVWPIFPLHLKIAAIGAGTAKILHQENFPEVLYPDSHWHSEGLLDLPEFRQVRGAKITLVRGEGGREWLADTLTVRGALVSQMVVYRRLLPHVDTSEYTNLLQSGQIDIIVTTSNECMRNLKYLFEDSWQFLQTIPLVVISQRMFDLAVEMGFQQIFLAKNAGHSAIMDALSLIKEG
jgi:uroporphyrinogen-III synthase